MKRLLGLLVAAVGVVVSVQPSQTQNILRDSPPPISR